VFITLEKARYLSVSEEGVHAFQETRIEDIRLVHDETNLFALATGTTKNSAQIIIEIFTSVLVRYLDLKNAQTVHPSHETR
jgi:hypothetical protein